MLLFVAAITPRTWERYWELRRQGWNVAQAAKELKIGYSTARAREANLKNSSGDEWRQRRHAQEIPEPIPYADLKPEAARALDDFAYFRRRYFGRVSTPWQEEAAYTSLNLLNSPRKEFAVLNAPPGSGKSTTFTLDIPAWITVKRRTIRGLMGHANQKSAERYLLRLKQALETTLPYKAEDEEIEKGLAFDAEATLAEDFGLFRPIHPTLWTQQAIIVAQFGNIPINEKEPTWSAYGLDTGFIGGRYDLCLWDDATEEKDHKTLENIDTKRSRWDKVAEKRLEPQGLLVLQGQRLSPEDLYRHSLDKPARRDHKDCCEAEDGRKYHHIRFRSHWEDRCDNDHGRDALPYPAGCLLDPHRLSWEDDLEPEIQNPLSNFQMVYQQEDADPQSVLVQKAWIEGGTDPHTGEILPGCLDRDRGECELPPNLAGLKLSIVTADPSPTKFWSVQWWIVTPTSGYRWLMAHERRVMDAPDFMDWDNNNQQWTGLMEEWQRRSEDLGLRITHWIVEQNAAQRFMLQYEHVTRWMSARSVSIIGHETHRNKSDHNLGITSLAPHYRFGRVRLPWKQPNPGRLGSQKLIDEVTKWPMGRYDDCVMAQWFLEWNLPKIYIPIGKASQQPRPGWVAQGMLGSGALRTRSGLLITSSRRMA